MLSYCVPSLGGALPAGRRMLGPGQPDNIVRCNRGTPESGRGGARPSGKITREGPDAVETSEEQLST